jgi:hypothetical protein
MNGDDLCEIDAQLVLQQPIRPLLLFVPTKLWMLRTGQNLTDHFLLPFSELIQAFCTFLTHQRIQARL